MANNTWEDIPEIKAPGRNLHSCCYLNGKIYMIGGHDGSSELNQVQVLNFREEIDEQRSEEWRILQVQEAQFTPRRNFAACPLNQKEILILGSYSPGDNKVFILDTETEQLQYIGEGGDINAFYAYQMPAAKIEDDKVIAVVTRKDT